MDFTEILYEKSVQDRVATVTINRPEALNSFTAVMMQEFRVVWGMIQEDSEVNAVVLRAADGPAFCPGVDVRNGGDVLGGQEIWGQRDPGELLGPKQNECWKPVVCAVHGMAAGGAFYWLNESDIVICSEDAQFFDPHVTYGLTAAVEPVGLNYHVPLQETLRMALLGNDERICAQTALRISLVTEVVAKDELWKRAYQLAATIAAKPSIATQGTTRAIWDALDMPRKAALKNALQYAVRGMIDGPAQVNRDDIMSKAKVFDVR